MEPENKLKIQANQKEIVATIAVADVEDHLIQFGLLSEEESEFIKVRGITRQEGVRRLLRIIQKKPDSFKIFCAALDEAYDWLADKIRETNPDDVSTPDEADGFEVGKIEQLQTQLWMTTQLVQKFKDELDTLKSENQTIKSQFAEFEKEMKDQGLSQQNNLKEYLQDYVKKREHPNRGAIESPDGSSVDTRSNLRRTSMGDPTNLTEAIARILAVDIVRYMANGEKKSGPPSNRYAETMRRLVTEVTTDRHRHGFRQIWDRLSGSLNQINGYDTLTQVADSMFEEQSSEPTVNWGRIVALYGFGGYIAQNLTGADDAFNTIIGDFLGFYVSTRLLPWIEGAGGWEAFVDRFGGADKRDGDAPIGKFVAASAVGGLAAGGIWFLLRS